MTRDVLNKPTALHQRLRSLLGPKHDQTAARGDIRDGVGEVAEVGFRFCQSLKCGRQSVGDQAASNNAEIVCVHRPLEMRR
jgi:hypothetical protein